METRHKRIEFIDLAKGVCIIMVVMGHCGCPLEIPGWTIVRMPLYFILSGLFFKDYGGWTNFLIKKVNKILIPFLFFLSAGVCGILRYKMACSTVSYNYCHWYLGHIHQPAVFQWANMVFNMPILV